ncbi:MAG TPA: glycosyl hydrolase family 65 protein [Acidimicrobiales bacterium]|nr:glycosyl hydrolase family 65 protein [Acidimicrobiales bacterium]
MSPTGVEVVVIDWDGPLGPLSAGLGRLLARGVDVVLVASAVTAKAAAGVAPGAPGRLVDWPGGEGATDWARHRLAGPGAPEGAVRLVQVPEDLEEVLAGVDAGFPAPTEDHFWRIVVDRSDPAREPEIESWLTVGNGRTGTRGSLEGPGPSSRPAFYVAGVFGWDPEEQAGPELVSGPEWTRVQARVDAGPTESRRTLDLRHGVLFGEAPGFRSARFASLADRDVLVLQVEGAPLGDVALPEAGGAVENVDVAVTEGGAHVGIQAKGGAGVWFAVGGADGTRLVAVDRDGPAHDALARARGQGPEELYARHRRAWRDRWLDADVVVDGDGQAQRDLRFALYHLIIAGDPESDRASIGARALTGPGYRGHVFWDTEVFCLPFFIWTHPGTARALLAYRHRTLPAARAKAARMGYAGALFAWESADTGEETTPESVRLPDGTELEVLTGIQEHHIAADVAWAVWQYWQVTGDDAFVAGMGAEIVLETARFWASRTTVDAAGAHHICGVIGPDEYHEGVDDNAFTNVLARWNLRAADGLCDRFPEVAGRLGVTPDERERWEEVAAGLVVAFDPETGLYEQFAGFFERENVRAVDLAPRPFTAEMVVGVDRLGTTQVIKQADVLMLGVTLPGEVDLRAQMANYRYYEPRTSHGSSLSPAMHALVAARVGDLDDALSYFHLAGGVDLDNRMGNAADGVHIATMGGLWQAAVFGFGGVRADGGAVRIDPRLPPAWAGLSFPIRWRGTRIGVDLRADALELDLEAPAMVAVGQGAAMPLGAGRFVARRECDGWSMAGPV